MSSTDYLLGSEDAVNEFHELKNSLGHRNNANAMSSGMSLNTSSSRMMHAHYLIEYNQTTHVLQKGHVPGGKPSRTDLDSQGKGKGKAVEIPQPTE